MTQADRFGSDVGGLQRCSAFISGMMSAPPTLSFAITVTIMYVIYRDVCSCTFIAVFGLAVDCLPSGSRLRRSHVPL